MLLSRVFGIYTEKSITKELECFTGFCIFKCFLDKQPGLVRPDDFRKSSNVKVIYKGLLRRYREYLWTHDLAQAFGGHVTKQAM